MPQQASRFVRGKEDRLSKEQESKEEGARSFARFLQYVGDGEAEPELSKKLNALMRKLSEQSDATRQPKKGRIVLTLDFKCEPGDIVHIGWDVKVKEPEESRLGSTMWLTRKGKNLTPDNPRQQKLPLREVGGPGEAQDVGGDAAEVRSV